MTTQINEATPLANTSKTVPYGELIRYSVASPPKHEKYFLGITYMMAMGICGIVLVALGSTLADLAEHSNSTATAIGSVFIARGLGAVLGAIFSAKLYVWFQGSHIMTYSLLLIATILVILPFNNSYILLHVYFLILGIGTSITDTGCQIMTRKIHGAHAGPWLGANTVTFGIAGAFVPLVELLTTSVFIQFYIVAFIVIFVALMIAMGPQPERDKNIGGPRPGECRPPSPHYYVEVVIALMVFCFIGGKVTTTAYLATYVEEMGDMSRKQGSMLILILWVFITIGRLAGVQDQRYLTNKTLPEHLTVLCIGGTLSMALVLLYPSSVHALYIGFAGYGLFNGPCVGYCYDLNNRITAPSEKSMAIVMFGLNFGASLVPYVTSLAWNEGGGPVTLVLSTLLSMVLPLPLLLSTRYLSYNVELNPLLKHEYEQLDQEEQGAGDEEKDIKNKLHAKVVVVAAAADREATAKEQQKQEEHIEQGLDKATREPL